MIIQSIEQSKIHMEIEKQYSDKKKYMEIEKQYSDKKKYNILLKIVLTKLGGLIPTSRLLRCLAECKKGKKVLQDNLLLEEWIIQQNVKDERNSFEAIKKLLIKTLFKKEEKHCTTNIDPVNVMIKTVKEINPEYFKKIEKRASEYVYYSIFHMQDNQLERNFDFIFTKEQTLENLENLANRFKMCNCFNIQSYEIAKEIIEEIYKNKKQNDISSYFAKLAYIKRCFISINQNFHILLQEYSTIIDYLNNLASYMPENEEYQDYLFNIYWTMKCINHKVSARTFINILINDKYCEHESNDILEQRKEYYAFSPSIEESWQMLDFKTKIKVLKHYYPQDEINKILMSDFINISPRLRNLT